MRDKQTKQFQKPLKKTFSHLPEDVQPDFDQKNTMSLINTAVSVDLENLDEQINSMMDQTEKANQRRCNVCGFEGARAFVVRHIEANHITGVSHPCDICGKTARSRNAMQAHKSVYHK